MTIKLDPRFVCGPRLRVPSVKTHCDETCQHKRGRYANTIETYWVTDAFEEEEQEEACDAAVARAERGAEAAHDTRDAVHAQQKGGVNEAEERGTEESPAGEGKLTEGEHEARARVGDAYALVDEVVHRERGDAHLRAAAECTRVSYETNAGTRRWGTGYAHIAHLRDKAEYTVVLLVEGPHICCFLATRGSELAREGLLRDLRQVAEAKPDHGN